MSNTNRHSLTQAFYDEVADSYERLLPDTRAEQPLDLGFLSQFAATLPTGANPVLDAGCGTGRLFPRLEELGVFPLAGTDLSAGMLAHAHSRAPEIPLHRAPLHQLPFSPGSLRGILCWYAIVHEDADGVAIALEEFARVLQPGGVLMLAFHAGQGERIIEGAYGHDIRIHGVLHDPAVITDLLRGAGFEVLATAGRAPLGHERLAQGFVHARKPALDGQPKTART